MASTPNYLHTERRKVGRQLGSLTKCRMVQDMFTFQLCKKESPKLTADPEFNLLGRLQDLTAPLKQALLFVGLFNAEHGNKRHAAEAHRCSTLQVELGKQYYSILSYIIVYYSRFNIL